jgi:branched-chain amino acid transport system permease protein
VKGVDAVRANPIRMILWVVAIAVAVVLPFVSAPFRVDQYVGWMTVAVASAGLNLLTGYNGQISVGHGALYGTGAYTVALLVTDADWPLLPTVIAAAVVCFIAGVVIGLPALRIKGLYLALVTLAVATLFPLVIEQFSDLTGGGSGLALTSEQLYRGSMRERRVRWESPIDGLASDQFKYFIMLVISILCFVVVANLVKSRIGRSLVAIRDNEIAAEVSGINVSRTKIITFGVSAAIAGIGGAMFALNKGQVNPTSFTLTLSIYFLVAVVLGGAATVVGPAIGAVVYGLFVDVISPELPESLHSATPLILGVLLVIQMLLAPRGVVGAFNELTAKRAKRRLDASGGGKNVNTGPTPGTRW